MNLSTELITAGRDLTEAGLSPGTSGNLSVRTDADILMTGTGVRLGSLREQDLATLNLDGKFLSGAKASKEVPLHVAMYAKNPHHAAIVHVHSPYAVAVSCLPPWSTHTAVPPLTPYALMRVGQVPLLPFLPPGDADLGDLVLNSPHPFHAALLAHHGAVISAETLPQAVDSATELEEACRIAILTANTKRRTITPERIREITAKWNTPWSEPH